MNLSNNRNPQQRKKHHTKRKGCKSQVIFFNCVSVSVKKRAKVRNEILEKVIELLTKSEWLQGETENKWEVTNMACEILNASLVYKITFFCHSPIGDEPLGFIGILLLFLLCKNWNWFDWSVFLRYYLFLCRCCCRCCSCCCYYVLLVVIG